jgi:hypothetical protein
VKEYREREARAKETRFSKTAGLCVSGAINGSFPLVGTLQLLDLLHDPQNIASEDLLNILFGVTLFE